MERAQRPVRFPMRPRQPRSQDDCTARGNLQPRQNVRTSATKPRIITLISPTLSISLIQVRGMFHSFPGPLIRHIRRRTCDPRIRDARSVWYYLRAACKGAVQHWSGQTKELSMRMRRTLEACFHLAAVRWCGFRGWFGLHSRMPGGIF